MAIRTTTDPEHQLVVQHVEGLFEVDELIEALRRLYRDPFHDPGAPVLWDAREAHANGSTLEQVERLIEGSREFWLSAGRGRAAIVVASEAHAVDPGESRGTRVLGVFTAYDEAVRWLVGRGGETKPDPPGVGQSKR